MAKIYAPNNQYTGVSAGVSFNNGIGETDNPRILAWFRTHGYKVAEPVEKTEGEPQKNSKENSSKKAGE